MHVQLTALIEAMSSLDRSWGDAEDAADLSREQLIAIDRAIGMVKRRLDAVHADVAAGISRESRPELGAEHDSTSQPDLARR